MGFYAKFLLTKSDKNDIHVAKGRTATKALKNPPGGKIQPTHNKSINLYSFLCLVAQKKMI